MKYKICLAVLASILALAASGVQLIPRRRAAKHAPATAVRDENRAAYQR